MVYYGTKNSIQSYGGGSVVLNKLHAKPCYFPTYDVEEMVGIAYVYISDYDKKIVLRRHSGTKIFRFIIYYR